MAAELASQLQLPEVLPSRPHTVRRSVAHVWSGLWPKVGAVVLTVVIWQLVVWSGWKTQTALPGPWLVVERLAGDLRHLDFYAGVGVTLRRAALGYAIAAGAAIVVAILIARIELARRSVGSLLVGLQSMPSIAWFPLAILLLQRSEGAITLVVVMGAAPAIAAGLLSGIDHVHPLLIRVGRAMGADGLSLYRHVILPAALPAFVGGLKQGWAFAWRSLMSAELLVVAANQTSIGQQLQSARNLSDTQQLLAIMIVIFVVGVGVDSLFGTLDKAIRRRWGLLGAES
ncbi:MAG: ABC transporter permease [Actinobacteria bacterium 13_1_40CM_2_65_8]|nr:MAG: ABC transporter permease [Chloroflexi bacterium 13_1_40CM_65_17]OLC68988.1 MAG: ABC transporter permease [Actinobacteria bacterium 13_1_40CM_4_65_12]OLD48889.1 MAG: ABC transporter permease [Actinobacteria bacterium 13_1_40CM_2_65_8]